MRTHIDWLTFTMPMIYGIDTPDAYAVAIGRGFLDMFGENIRREVFGGDWGRYEHGRAPYIDSWGLEGKGLRLFASPTLTHACVEISGEGCELLIQACHLESVLRACEARVTRIDIATDIITEITPEEFAAQRSHQRMRGHAHIVSETGETYYVGSQKSDRFARIYRYNSPHPRSNLLRVEHVFRRGYAKLVTAAYIEAGIDCVAKAAGDAFGWAHPIWDTDGVTGADLSLVRERGNTGTTVFWLINSCASAFKRLCADGTIRDPKAFLDTYFLTDCSPYA